MSWQDVVVFIALLIFLAFMAANKADASEYTRDEIDQLVIAEALEVGIDPNLALAIMEVESGGNPNAIGSLGEIGLFQLRPNFHDVRPGDVVGNIRVALRYLAYTRSRCFDDYGDAFFVCFNHGPFRRVHNPRETSYYKKVKRAYKAVIEARN